MKWFKHLTDSHIDEKLAALLASHGAEGYGFWWLIVEAVANQIGKDGDKCSVSYPMSYWMRLTGVYHLKKARILFECMSNLSLIYAQCSPNVSTIYDLSMKDVLTISIPNILKYRDEYSKKSGQKKESVGPKKEMENTEVEVDKEKPTSSPSYLAPLEQKAMMTINDFRFLFTDNFKTAMPPGCNQLASELCQHYPRDAIVEAFRISAEQGKNSVAYVKGVLMGNGKKKIESCEFDITKDYEPGSYFDLLKKDTLERKCNTTR